MISVAQQNLEDGLYAVLDKPDVREVIGKYQDSPAEELADISTKAMMSELGVHIRLLEAAYPRSTLCTEAAFKCAILRLIREWRTE